MRLLSRAPHPFMGPHKLRRHDWVTIWTDDRCKQIRVRFAGAGVFSNVFYDPVTLKTYIVTAYDEHSKDILAHIKNRSQHIPPMKHIGEISGPVNQEWNYMVHESKLYSPNPKNLDMDYGTYKQLRLLQQAHRMAQITNLSCYEFNDYMIKLFKNSGGSHSLVRALWLINESALDWGDHYVFDSFSRRNVALDWSSKGTLVLIDPVFDSAMVKRAALLRMQKSSKN